MELDYEFLKKYLTDEEIETLCLDNGCFVRVIDLKKEKKEDCRPDWLINALNDEILEFKF